MTEVGIIVTVQVDPDAVGDKRFSEEQLRATALQAITHAVKYGQGEGFVHDLAHDVSIGVAGVDLMVEPRLRTEGEGGPCPDQGCPGGLYSDGRCSHCGFDYEEQ